jgi:hypothetical protein
MPFSDPIPDGDVLDRNLLFDVGDDVQTNLIGDFHPCLLDRRIGDELTLNEELRWGLVFRS